MDIRERILKKKRIISTDKCSKKRIFYIKNVKKMTKKGQKNESIQLLGTGYPGLSNSVSKKRIKVTDTDKKRIKILFLSYA